MGDRGNIFVREQWQDELDKGVYLYSHWTGYKLPKIMQEALRRGQRLNYGAYLARIIFDTMTDGRQGEETGFGISTRLCDFEYHLIVVDVDKKVVEFINIQDNDTVDFKNPVRTYSFEEYAKLKEPGYPK